MIRALCFAPFVVKSVIGSSGSSLSHVVAGSGSYLTMTEAERRSPWQKSLLMGLSANTS
jgi:hypothetical protein